MKHPDYTFWTRLLSFTEDININDYTGQQELGYIKYVATRQLKQQYDHATGEELEYLDKMKTTDKIN